MNNVGIILLAIFDKQGKNLTIKNIFKKFMDKVFFSWNIYLFIYGYYRSPKIYFRNGENGLSNIVD